MRTTHPRRALATAACALAALWAMPGHTALFDDDEARRAILELRQRVDTMQQANQRTGEQSGQDVSQLRRSMLEQQTQIEALRTDLATLRGQYEQLQRSVAELQSSQKNMVQGVDERLRQFEPVTVQVDGREFRADPAEKRQFETALDVLRSGKYEDAAAGFGSFLRQFPQSGYAPSARFWLGNAQYATRDYKGAISSFKALLSDAPDHARAPEAALSIANCQVELKDARAARKTLEDLLRAYPQSEAAAAAKERLARLK